MTRHRFSMESLALAVLYAVLFVAVTYALQMVVGDRLIWPMLMFVILFSTMYGRLLDLPL